MADDQKPAPATVGEFLSQQPDPRRGQPIRAQRTRFDLRIHFASIVAPNVLQKHSLPHNAFDPQEFARDVFEIADALVAEAEKGKLQPATENNDEA